MTPYNLLIYSYNFLTLTPLQYEKNLVIFKTAESSNKQLNIFFGTIMTFILRLISSRQLAQRGMPVWFKSLCPANVSKFMGMNQPRYTLSSHVRNDEKNMNIM
jgi:hypothetical protein